MTIVTSSALSAPLCQLIRALTSIINKAECCSSDREVDAYLLLGGSSGSGGLTVEVRNDGHARKCHFGLRRVFPRIHGILTERLRIFFHRGGRNEGPSEVLQDGKPHRGYLYVRQLVPIRNSAGRSRMLEAHRTTVSTCGTRQATATNTIVRPHTIPWCPVQVTSRHRAQSIETPGTPKKSTSVKRR